MKRAVWFIALLTLLLAAFTAMAQPWMEKFRGWDRDPSVQEIFQAFDEYWADKTPTRGSGWKQFQRWRWFVENRLDENGEFHSAAQWRGWQQKLQMFPANELDDADWQPLGPFEPIAGSYVGGLGRVNCMEQDPTNPNHMYAGAASGGLWVTFTGGFSWVPLTDNLPVLGVSDIEMDPTNPDVLYLATGDADGGDTYSVGILKSLDGGQTWNETGLNYTVLEGERIARVLLDPDNHNTVIAATSNGIYKSTDGGANWTQELAVGGFLHDLEVVASDPDTWYAAAEGVGVYRSTNDGDSWSPLTNGLPYNNGGTGRINVEVADSSPNLVFALYANTSNGFYGFYKSYDGGDSWSLLTNSPNLLGWDVDGNDTGGQAWYDLTLVVNPQNPNLVYIGGVNVWKSTNGGASWDCTGFWYYGPAPYVHADQHRHEYFIENNIPILYSGNDGGLYRTTDGGDNWDEISHGLVVQQLYRLGVYQNSPQVEKIIFGNQDNGTKLKDGDEFFAVIGGDGMEGAIDPTDSNYMYGEVYYGGLERSTNGGDSWQDATNGIQEDGRWVTPYVIDPNNPSRLWFGTDRIYRSQNHAASWTAMSPSAGGGYSDKMTAMAIAPSETDMVYGLNPNGEILFTLDGGASWDTNVVPATPATYIAVHPLNDSILYVSIGGYNAANKVFASYDRGETWTNLSAGLPNLPVNCVALNPLDGNHVYIGTDAGVFFSDDGGLTWQDWSTGLPNVIVNELEFHPNSNTLVAATYGRGIWASPAEEVNVEPVLTVIAPDGGEEWTIGSEATIRWQSYGIQGNVRIEMNRNYPNGGWDTIVDATQNDWAYTWNVTGPATSNAAVRISSIDDPQYSDESDAVFSLLQASITILHPNGGEILPLGLYYMFEWESVAIDGSVAIEINRNYPNGGWEVIVPAIPDPGHLLWLANGAETSNARLRIRALDLQDIEDVSDDNFSILNVPAIMLNSPAVPVNWNIGEQHTITWNDNFAQDVLIEFLPQQGDPLQIAQTPSDGSFSWTLGENLTPGEVYNIRLSKVDDPGVSDTGDATVTVGLMAPDELSPSGGDYVNTDPVVFTWDEVPAADHYIFDLAEGPVVDPEHLIFTGSVGGATTSYSLGNGEYSWQVTAVAAVEVESDTSETAIFNVDFTSVSEWRSDAIPDDFALTRVYPNPFNPASNIVIALPVESVLSVMVYNVTGELITTLADGSFSAGYHTFVLDGSHLASGAYFLKVKVPGKLDATQRMMLIK